jgi:hypothetical protein
MTLDELAMQTGWSNWDLCVGGRYAPMGQLIVTEPLPDHIRLIRDEIINQCPPSFQKS